MSDNEEEFVGTLEERRIKLTNALIEQGYDPEYVFKNWECGYYMDNRGTPLLPIPEVLKEFSIKPEEKCICNTKIEYSYVIYNTVKPAEHLVIGSICALNFMEKCKGIKNNRCDFCGSFGCRQKPVSNGSCKECREKQKKEGIKRAREAKMREDREREKYREMIEEAERQQKAIEKEHFKLMIKRREEKREEEAEEKIRWKQLKIEKFKRYEDWYVNKCSVTPNFNEEETRKKFRETAKGIGSTVCAVCLGWKKNEAFEKCFTHKDVK